MKDLINKIHNADCLEKMKEIPDKSIDMVLCDLPYGTTACKWDTIIPFEPLWAQYKRIIKGNGVIVLTACQPFTTMLIASNLDLYRYSWIWRKESATGFLNANYAPLKITEDINIFSFGTVGSLSKNAIIFYPQNLVELNKCKKNNPNSKWRKNNGYNGHNKLNTDSEYEQKSTGYPNNILTFNRDKNTIHPTQKPVALFEYLIKTYTNEGDLVLDNCSGSGTTAIACLGTNRKYICIEKDKIYYQKSLERVEEYNKQLKLF